MKVGKEVVNPSKALPAKRGRKAIAPQWSRILDLDDADNDNIRVFEVEEDMARAEDSIHQAESTGKKGRAKKQEQWHPIYEPQAFWELTSNHSLAQNVLNNRMLKTYAHKTTQIRELFRERAAEQTEPDRGNSFKTGPMT